MLHPEPPFDAHALVCAPAVLPPFALSRHLLGEPHLTLPPLPPPSPCCWLQIFAEFDSDGSGSISTAEIKSAMGKLVRHCFVSPIPV